MSLSDYLLVEWTEESKFSVIKRTAIVDHYEKSKIDSELIGTIVKLLWRSRPYDAKIIQCGLKVDLSYELSVLIEEQNSIAEAALPANIEHNLPENRASEIQSVLNEVNTEHHDLSLNQRVTDLESELKKQVEITTRYKNKYKNLKRKHRDVREIDEGAVEQCLIGGDVYLPKSQLDTILALSETVNELARNLMKALFKEEELVGRSLFGRICNANLQKPASPAIESARRDAIILFTLNRFGLNMEKGNKKKAGNPILHDLHSSMGDFLRYRTRKQKV